jgi:hypothetical protein
MKKLFTLLIATFSISLSAQFNIPVGTYYFDNSQTGWSEVYLFIGHATYVRSYQMSSTGNAPDVFSFSLGSAWNAATGFYFANNSGGVTGGSGSYDIGTEINSLPDPKPTLKSTTWTTAPIAGDVFIPYGTVANFRMRKLSSNQNLNATSGVVSGTSVMFYINQSYSGDLGVTNGSSSTCITTLDKARVDASSSDNMNYFVEMASGNVPSTLSVTNNCGGWVGVGSFSSQTSANAAGARYITGASNSKTNASVVTTSANNTSIAGGTASITMTAAHSTDVTSSYSRRMYVQYYVNGVYSTSSTKLSGTSTATTLNTSNLAPGVYTIQSVITDRVVYYKTEDITLTVSGVSNQSGNWNEASTWIGNMVPINNAIVTISDGHIVTVSSVLTHSGNITVNSGGTLATNVTLTANGNVNINGTFRLNAGGWSTGTGTWNYGTGGTLSFQSGVSYGVNSDHVYWPAVNGPVNVTVGGVVANSALTLNSGANRTVSGTFETSGAITNTATLTVTGTCQINSGGYFTNSPTYSGTTTLIYNNGGEYTINTEWPASNGPTNVTVQNTGTKVIVNNNRTASGNLVINSNATLEVSAGKQLTITTGFSNSGTLILKSGEIGTATILTPTTISGTGNTTVEQYLATDRNWYMSSPISSPAAPEGYTYYEYREPGDNVGFVAPATAYWKSVSPGTSMNPGKGYIVNPVTAPATFTVSGILNNEDNIGPISLTRTAGKDKEGFNLVGNPFPSYLNISSINSNADLDKSYWLRARNEGNTAWIFDTYNISGSVGTSNSGLKVTALIPPMQAFWLRVSADKSTASLTFNNEMRDHKDSVLNKFRAPASPNPLVRLVVSNSENTDEAVIYFNQNAADSYDVYDSPKMFNNTAAVPEIYTRAGNEQLVINGLSQYYPGLQMPLGFVTGQTNNFSLRATELRNIDADIRVVLFDKQLNSEFDLTEGSAYSFSSDAVNTEERFAVLFKSASGTTDCCEITAAGMNIYSFQGRIHLSCNAEIAPNARFSVYNSNGQLVHAQSLSGYLTTTSRNFDAGVYLVKVENGGRSVVLRTVVN